MASQDKEKEVILITGATGFLGRHLVQSLLEAGFAVRALVRNAADREVGLPERVEIIEGDVLDTTVLTEATAGVTAVVHAAAMVSFWKKEAEQVKNINVEGTSCVVNACLEAGCRLIHVSSIAALGSVPEGEFVTEHTTWISGESRSAYSTSKLKAEREVFRGIAEGLNAQFVNPSIIIGPTHNWEEGTGKMFTIVNRGLRFYNPGASGFVGVKDVAKAIVAVIHNTELAAGEHFLLNAENLSFQTLFGMIAKALDKKPPGIKLPKFPTMIVATISEWISLLSGTPPIVARESMKSGFLSRKFDGSKIKSLGIAYQPISEVVEEAADEFKRREK